MFNDISHLIQDNHPRLSYGVAATDIDGDGLPEFVVTGFGDRNLVLDWDGGSETLVDVTPESIADPTRRSIGIAAGDVDGNGREEIYVLNSDTFMGMKRFGDRFFALDRDDRWIDLFDLPINLENPNLTAGRSVLALDPDGSGYYRIVVANYGGPLRIHQVSEDRRVSDIAPKLGIELMTGGRSLCTIPDITDYPALFCGNENDANALWVRDASGNWTERAREYGIADASGHARGVAVCDSNNDGLLDLILGNWEGPQRLFERTRDDAGTLRFVNRASAEMQAPGRVRTVVAADFDNDGRTEVFFNMLDEPNRLFRVERAGITPIDLGASAESDLPGTGAAVADIDGDGLLELLVAHGEREAQPLSLYRAADAGQNHFLRVIPLTRYGAPARGALVYLYSGDDRQVRIVDAGSGYLCQMEAVAHFGLGSRDSVDAIEIIWPGGTRRRIDNPRIDCEIEVGQ